MVDTFDKNNYSYTFQVKIITLLMSDETFLRDSIDLIKPEYFEAQPLKWLCTTCISYFEKYTTKITLEALKIELVKEISDPNLKKEIIESISHAIQHLKSDDLNWIKDEVLAFCRNQSMTSALMKSVDLLQEKRFDDIMATMTNAMRINTSNDLGHDFIEDIDKMFDESTRNTLETPWPIINEITDGGLGGGELGIFVAATGAGKCVGGDTIIDILYEEKGVKYKYKPIKWYNPLKKLNFNHIITHKAQMPIILTRIKNKRIKMKKLFNILKIENKEFANYIPEFNLMINTPYGYKKIVELFRTEKQNTITTYFNNGEKLKTSERHQLKVNDDWKYVKDIDIKNDLIEIKNGTTTVKKQIKNKKKEILYDISVEDIHCYYSNNILSHNSWSMINIAFEAMKHGKNVIYFTMELKAAYVALRFASLLTGISPQNIKYHKDEIKRKAEQLSGRLKIQYYPNGTASINTLKAYVEKCRLKGFVADIILIDYPDLLKNTVQFKRNDLNLGNIYADCRTLGGELNVPVWGASQAQRCLSLDTVVNINNKNEIIKNVKINDMILTHDGYKRIVNIFPIEKKPLYKIKLKSGKEIECSNTHEFPIKYGKLKSISTGLKVGNKLLTKKV